jgi:hypothetical protein
MMRQTIHHSARLLSVAALGASLLCVSNAPLFAQDAPHGLYLDAGIVLPVRLEKHLNSRDSWAGETFRVSVHSGDEFYRQLPPGTELQGVVRVARPQEGRHPGVLAMEFDQLILPSGRSLPVDGSLIGLDNKSVVRRGDGRLIALPSHKDDTMSYMGYGAGAGFILGAITKHPIHKAIVGGLIGGLIGAIESANDNSQPHEVDLKPGTEMGVRLNEPLRVSFDDAAPPVVAPPVRPDRPAHYGVGEDGGIRHGEGIGVMIGDKNVEFDPAAAPVETDDHVILIPVAPVLIAAHVAYRSDGHDRFVVRPDDGAIRAYVGSRIVRMPNGDRVRLDAPLQRINDAVYAPIRFLELVLDKHGAWDPASHTLVLEQGQDRDQ